MKKYIDILHIYSGTSGASGLYLNEIYSALNKKYKQEVIVSYNYPFNYGKKWFYRFTDISSLDLEILKIQKIRYIVRFLELITTLLKIYFLLLFNNIKYVNYNLTTDLFIEYIFLKFLKFNKKLKIIITCHDVLPFGTDNPIILEKKIKHKKRFFKLADYLIIHNMNSKKDLRKYYNIKDEKLLNFPFPLMDLNKLKEEKSGLKLDIIEKKFTVGMFGHFRKEKGLNILINAWNEFYGKKKDVQLIIAGNIPPNLDYDFSSIENKSTYILKNFIDDSLLKKLIGICDVVILPYERGTNSGLPSSILTNNTLLLASHIPMFVNNELIDNKFLFESKNSFDLVKKLEWIYLSENKLINELKFKNNTLINDYYENFYRTINSKFDSIMNIN